TDISFSLLDQAKQAVYGAPSIQRGMPSAFLQRFFELQGRRWVARPELRERVTFSRGNLVDSSPPGSFDLVLCRYVMSCFSDAAKRSVFATCARVLRAGGLLLLGAAESPSGYSDRFERVEHGHGCCYRLTPST